jgi:hypothetical protein
MRWNHRLVWLAGVCSVVVGVGFAAVAAPRSQHTSNPNVLTRFFTGTYIEDITYVTRGAFAAHLAMVQGDGLYTIPLNAVGSGALKKLIDFRGLLTAVPRGIAYISRERVHAMLDGQGCDQLVIFDDNGRFVERRQIKHLNGYVPNYCEGLAYIPDTSPDYPGHLLLAVNEPVGVSPLPDNYKQRVEVLRTDGQVVREVFPRQPELARFDTIFGVTFKAPDDILISVNLFDGTGELWTLTFDGLQDATPVTLTQGIVEGLIQVPDGRIIATGVSSDLHAFDASLQPVPGWHRDFQLGQPNGITPNGIAWNPTAETLLVNTSDLVSPFRTIQAFSPAAGTGSASLFLDFTTNQIFGPRGLTYLASDGLLAVANTVAGPAGPPPPQWPLRRIYLFDGAGTLAGKVALQPPGGGAPERPALIEYLPTTNEFAVRTMADATRVQIFSRMGIFVRSFDPRPDDVASVGSFAYFTGADGSGRLLFIMSNDQGAVTDLNGHILMTFNWREALGLIEPHELAYMASGPYAGAFAVTELTPGIVTIFTLPD